MLTQHDIAIVEEDGYWQYALQQMLHHAPEYICIGVFENTTALLLSEHNNNLSLVIFTEYELQNLHQLLPAFSDLKIIVTARDVHAVEVLVRNATDVVRIIFKGSAPAEYLSLMKQLLFKDVSAHNAQTVIHNKTSPSADLLYSNLMTEREKQIIGLLHQGLLYKEIATRLHISIETVRQHCAHIYQKLHVQNRTEAVNKCFGH